VTAATSIDAPIGDVEADSLLSRALAGYATVLLAVSGGADSMALLHLAASWHARTEGPKPRLQVATVDHGLRPESTVEAGWVAQRTAALGLPHRIVTWSDPKPATGVQAAAREARYRLLADLARTLGSAPVAIALAHHLDDQAETFLMRLARGSGIDGLAAMPARRALSACAGCDDASIDIVRPLLSVPKQRLIATLHGKGLSWLEDPTNDQPRFERVRLRRASGALRAAGLGSDKLALSAARIARARQALEQATDALEAAAVDYHAGSFATLQRARLQAAPAEIGLRAIGRALALMGGQPGGPRLSLLERLVGRLNGATEVAGITLSGCCVEVAGAEIRIYREPGRGGLPAVSLPPGASVLWDRRFLVSAPSGGQRALTVRALPPNELAQLKKTVGKSIPAPLPLPRRAALTVPSVWDGDELLAVPHLSPPPTPAGLALQIRWIGQPEPAQPPASA